MDDRPIRRSRRRVEVGPRAALQRLAEALLDPGAAAVDASAAGLHDLLGRLAGLGEGDEWARETALPSGRALSPLDAARCARDGARTAAFLRGGAAALDALGRRDPGRPVELLYAGTGPLAPLVLPLLALREEGSVRVTFLDVHPAAASAVARLLETLGLGAFARQVVAADATAWQPPGDAPFDLLVVEAMERSLAREPQAAICRHLVPRLAPAGLLLPERVAVDLVLSDPEVETASDADAATRGPFPEVTLVLPEAIGPRRRATLVTSVRVFGDHVVAEGVSGLTTPEVLWAVPSLPAGGRLSFRYREGSAPGLAWRIP